MSTSSPKRRPAGSVKPASPSRSRTKSSGKSNDNAAPKKSKKAGNDPTFAFLMIGLSFSFFFFIAGAGYYLLSSSGVIGSSGEAKEIGLAQFETTLPSKVKSHVSMRWEMPENWKVEQMGVEDGRWPWANIKTDRGEAIKIKHNRSLLDKADMASAASFLGDDPFGIINNAHYTYKHKAEEQYTDYKEDPLKNVQGKFQPIASSDFQYKGLFGTVYGIRFTATGGLDPAVIWLECGQDEREYYRPLVSQLTGSIEYFDPNDEDEIVLEMGNQDGDDPENDVDDPEDDLGLMVE